MNRTGIETIVDLQRYPITQLGSSRTQQLIEAGQRELDTRAVFSLPGFVRDPALAQMRLESQQLLPHAYARTRERDGIGLARPLPTRASMSCIGFDQMPQASPMRLLYLCDELTSFLAALLRRKPYHRSADPLASCMITAMHVDDELGWHFDDNDGVVTLTLDACARGGDFEYVPDARSLNETRLAQIVEGDHTKIVQLHHAPGTLTLFNGHNALHRVSRVSEGPARLTLILSYDSEEDQVFSDDIRQGFFGRSQPAQLPTPSA